MVSVPLVVDLLGDFRLRAGGAELPASAWRSQRAASLTKLLALEPGHALHRERLCDLLWPTFEPDAAANNLRQALHQARATLQSLPLPAGSLLCNCGERLSLYPSGDIVTDVELFESTASLARQTNDPELYRRAIDAYHGRLLPDVLYEDWVEARREALSSLHAALLGDLGQLYQAHGDLPRALDVLQRLVAVEPTDEGAVVPLMRLLAISGRRSAALKHYRALEHVLAHELDATPGSATKEVFEAIRDGRIAPVASVLTATATPPVGLLRCNLPSELSNFIGRGEEIGTIAALLAEHRLVTLTGPGGVGKTRLALEVGHRWLAERTDEVWLIELAPLTDPSALPQAIGGVLGISTEGPGGAVEALATALGGRRMLLILDNCEHLIAECVEVVAALLRRSEHLRVLATSRTALRLPGGQRWAMHPLAAPTIDAGLLELAKNDAVRLFVDRVRWRQPTFALSDENAADVAAICQRVDGIPLALELAAAKISVLTVSQLAARLSDALGLLTSENCTAPDRQQTLRATLDWSYALLNAEQQILFRRLAVFSGGWTIESVEAVCAGGQISERDVLGLLEQLVERSQVQVESADNAAWYRLLEPVRQYAAELLEASGEAEIVRVRHAAHVLDFVEDIEPALSGPSQTVWLGPLEREHGNIRSALGWALSRNDATTVLRLSCALARYWSLRWMSMEGLTWLESGLGLPTADRSALRARAARRAGELARQLVDFDRARSWLEEALDISRDIEDSDGAAWALILLADILEERGDWANVRAHAQQSLELFRADGDEVGIGRALNVLGEDARFAGDYSQAKHFYTEALEHYRTGGDHLRFAIQFHNLGYVALVEGDVSGAARSFRECYLLSRAAGYLGGSSLSFLEGMGAVASAGGRPREAVRLYAAFTAACACAETEFKLHQVDQVEYDRYLSRARDGLSPIAFSRFWMQGTALSREQAVAEALALAEELAGERSLPATVGFGALTGRERDVACLVADHLTNHQIALRLGLSERTVDTHVSHILHKLRVSTRGQIADLLRGGKPT